MKKIILSLGVLFLAISQSAFAAVSTGYYDIDSDAQVETIEIDFGENIDTCTYEASDWTIDTAGSIDVTAVTAVTCNASIATLTVTTHINITGGATDPIITYTNQGTANSMVINGTNLATTNFTAVDKAAPIILRTSINSSNPHVGFAKEGEEVTFMIIYSENVVSTSNSATSANNVTTLKEDVTANNFNVDLIKFEVVDGDNGLVTPNNIDYSIEDMAAAPNTTVITSLGTIIGSITTDTVAPVITSAATVDADENQINAITITASGDPVQFHKTGGNDAGLFSIDIPTGAITFNTAPDFENPADNGANNDYDFTVTARDAAGNDSTVQAVVVSVKNVNEAPNIVDYVISRDEDIAIGTQITIIGDGGNFMDNTDVDGDAITYSIVAGNTNDDFAIDAVGGTLTNVHNLDFETTPSYTLTVQGTDGTLTDTGIVSIAVNDIAEAPTMTSSYSISVPENQINVMVVTAVDPQGDDITFSIETEAWTDDFNIDAVTGALTFVTAPDFENPTDKAFFGDLALDNKYHVKIRLEDDNGNRSGAYILTITVTDTSESSGHSGKSHKTTSTKKVCKDSRATNFNNVGQHDASLCKYTEEKAEEVRKEAEEQTEEQVSNKCSLITGTKSLLRFGSRGQAVKDLQEFLNTKGFNTGVVDGIFGKLTRAAVKAMQTSFGISSDGVVGPQTRGKVSCE